MRADQVRVLVTQESGQWGGGANCTHRGWVAEARWPSSAEEIFVELEVRRNAEGGPRRLHQHGGSGFIRATVRGKRSPCAERSARGLRCRKGVLRAAIVHALRSNETAVSNQVRDFELRLMKVLLGTTVRAGPNLLHGVTEMERTSHA